MKGNTSRRVIAAVVIMSLLLFSGAAAAAQFDVTSGVEYTTDSGLTVTAGEDHTISDDPFKGSDEVVVNNVSFTASAGSNVTATNFLGGYTNLSEIDAASTNITINPDDKPAVTVGNGIDSINFSDPVVDDNTDDFTYAASGSALVTIKTSTANQKIVATNATGTILDSTTTDGSGTAVFDNLPSGSKTVSLQKSATPSLSNPDPSDNTQVSATTVNLSVDVTDDDFDDTDDTVTVEFYNATDETLIDSQTISSNQTVSTEWDVPNLGENYWFANATDTISQTDKTKNLTVDTPSELKIYNETQPSQLIDSGATFRVRAYANDNVLLERSTSDGTLSLQGFPTDERVIITVADEGSEQYTYRRIIVDDITEQQSIYLLNNTQPSSRILFELDDSTGKFLPGSTRLYVERPITKDYDGDNTNETRYQVIAGDTFGSVGEFPAILQTDARYRLRVESDQTESSRILGAYSVSGSQRVPLQIQRISPSGDIDQKPVVYGGVEGDTLAVRYFDPEMETDSVEYRIIYGNGTEYIPNTTRTSNQFADVYQLPETQANFTVEYTIDRGSVSRSGSFAAGEIVQEIAPRLNLDPRLLEIVSYLVILASMGLVVLVNSSLAPIAGTGVAATLTMIGTVAIPTPILGIAGAISVLLPFGRRT